MTMNGWVDGWMNEWMDGWMNEWVDEWMDGTQFPLKGVLGATGVLGAPNPFTPRTPFKGNLVMRG